MLECPRCGNPELAVEVGDGGRPGREVCPACHWHSGMESGRGPGGPAAQALAERQERARTADPGIDMDAAVVDALAAAIQLRGGPETMAEARGKPWLLARLYRYAVQGMEPEEWSHLLDSALVEYLRRWPEEAHCIEVARRAAGRVCG